MDLLHRHGAPPPHHTVVDPVLLPEVMREQAWTSPCDDVQGPHLNLRDR